MISNEILLLALISVCLFDVFAYYRYKYSQDVLEHLEKKSDNERLKKMLSLVTVDENNENLKKMDDEQEITALESPQTIEFASTKPFEETRE